MWVRSCSFRNPSCAWFGTSARPPGYRRCRFVWQLLFARLPGLQSTSNKHTLSLYPTVFSLSRPPTVFSFIFSLAFWNLRKTIFLSPPTVFSWGPHCIQFFREASRDSPGILQKFPEKVRKVVSGGFLENFRRIQEKTQTEYSGV